MNENNGNGHQKAFELTTPKTAEEIAQDSLNKLMPKLRRACSRDHRLKRFVGAKWLFDTLTDNSFMNDLGGDGFGKVYVSLKDLHRLYGHDEDTLANWRDKLIETGWIWYQERWPKSCWGIAGATRQPELFSPHRDFVRVMAKASAQDQPPAAVAIVENGKTANFGHNNQPVRLDQPPAAVTPTATDGQTDRILRLHQPPATVSVGGESRSDQPPTAVTPTATYGQTNGTGQVGQTEGTSHTKETPPENGVGREESSKRSTGFNARNGSGGAKKINAENHFLLEVAAMMELWKKGSSKAELKNSGGGWRSRYRANPDLAERVIAEIRCMIKEGKIKENAAAAAVDLWKRWSLPILKQKVEKKAAGGTAAGS